MWLPRTPSQFPRTLGTRTTTPLATRSLHLTATPNSDSLALSTECGPSAWFKHHLFLLGYDKFRFYAYRKLSPLSLQNGGGFVKAVVGDLASFVKREWSAKGELFSRVYSQLAVYGLGNITDARRLYTSIGQLLAQGYENDVESVTDEIINLYLKHKRNTISLVSAVSDSEKQVLKIASNYYKNCKVDYKMLYDPARCTRSISLPDRQITIDLPPLPHISSKQLLVRALLHKELYLALTSPKHSVQNTLRQKKVVTVLSAKIIRYDLSFLDGLGDLLISTEAGKFIYRFKSSHPYSSDTSFGKNTFNLLKTILGTNTLLSRLAMAYNLHNALKDECVSSMLRDCYIPNTVLKQDFIDPQIRRYEEEFLADYFEQYVGALFLNSPEAAQQWLQTLFEKLLFVITDIYSVPRKKRLTNTHFNYRAWGVDMLGRSI